MNWFKRHLNWTLLIASTLIPLIMLLLAYFVNESLGSTFPKIIGWTLSILLLVIYGWVLRQKKRSLWWLLLWWYPIGCFIYIGLSNKNESSNLGVTNSVLVKEFQEEITPKLKWLYIGDIPDFPLSNFDEVKSKISTGIYSIGIDYTTANQLSRWLYGTGHKNLVVFLASTPVFICIISIVLSIVLGNYWLLFGIAIGILGFFMANPYNPARNFWLIVVVLVVIGMVTKTFNNGNPIA